MHAKRDIKIPEIQSFITYLDQHPGLVALIQALVSVVAVLVIGIVAIRQSRTNHQANLEARERERTANALHLAMAVDTIAKETSDSIMFAVKGLNSPQKVHDIANGTKYFRRDGVAIHQHSMERVPLYQLTSPNLIRLALNMAGMASQVQDATETILRTRKMLDKEAFDAFFNEMDQMASSADDIARAIHHEVESSKPNNTFSPTAASQVKREPYID
ncbi:MAG TPA: hypothetical protein VFS17_03115 [Methylophilaceae bacterium]|nr:hypothetical protein [Methylophilaceae bacterium]